MTTVLDAINQLRTDYLLTGRREERNRLLSAMTSSVTIIPLEFALKGVQEGSKVSVGLEDMGIWSTNPGSKTAVVQRGDYGSTAAAHSIGDIVFVNAKWTNGQILRAINDELHALSSPSNGLFKISTVELTNSPEKTGYNLTGVTDVITVWDVRYSDIGAETDWPRVKFWEHTRNANTTDFPSGHALFIREATAPGQAIRVWFKAPFTALAAESDDLNTAAGVPVTADDVVILGAAIRLITGREVTRNLDEVQGDTRRATEVPSGGNLNGLRAIQAIYDRRKREEASRLDRFFPDHRRT